MTIIKLRSRISNGYIYETIFMGEEGYTLENAGELKYSIDNEIGQWQIFGATLKCGEIIANKNYQHVKVIIEGDEKIIQKLELIEKEKANETLLQKTRL